MTMLSISRENPDLLLRELIYVKLFGSLEIKF